MRLPNGYGSIVKLSGNRRRPYGVRITTGWTDEGKQIQKYLSFHAKRSDALAALAEYNKSPYNIDNKNITFAQIYERWIERCKDGEIPREYSSAYTHLSNLHNMPFMEIRRRHIQYEIDSCNLSVSSLEHMKTLCSALFKYAIDMELVTINQSVGVELPERVQSEIHHPFSDEELGILWQNTDDFATRLALIFSYTGLRPSELLKIRTENVDLSKRCMRGGLKNQTSRNRIIPLAKKILPFIQDMYCPEQEYLVVKNGHHLTYSAMRHYWNTSTVLQSLPTPHLPHDGRHTCASRLSDKEVDLKTRQLILGHRSKNITEYVYTHKSLDQLLAAIDLI